MELVAITADGTLDGDPRLPDVARGVVDSYIDLYARTGYLAPWNGYLARDESGQFIGSCGFKGPPVHEQVEISYFTFPDHEGGGVATRMAAELIHIALEADPNLMIAARTQPQEGPSSAVLRRLGFRNIGKVQDPQDGTAWEWQLEH